MSLLFYCGPKLDYKINPTYLPSVVLIIYDDYDSTFIEKHGLNKG